jgi:hypothetical protein
MLARTLLVTEESTWRGGLLDKRKSPCSVPAGFCAVLGFGHSLWHVNGAKLEITIKPSELVCFREKDFAHKSQFLLHCDEMILKPKPLIDFPSLCVGCQPARAKRLDS